MKPLLEYVRLATGHFQAQGIDTARLDAETLLAHVLNIDRLQLYVQADRPMNEDEVARYREVVSRRARREPVAYIVGEREFYSLPVKVDHRVLIPRPETEGLVDEAVAQLQLRFPRETPWRLAEVGVGSGAITLALLKNHPQIVATATDIDAGALDVARQNARIHGVDDRITFLQGDLLQPLRGQKFHAIVSNPPYIAPDEVDALPPDVRQYEPMKALVGGDDGLYHVRRLIDGGADCLVSGGFMAIEIGSTQGATVRRMALDAGYRVMVHQDGAGLDRIVCMWK